MVEMGLGSAIVPQLSAFQGGRPLFDVRLYALPVPHREIIALAPEHYVTLQSLRGFLDALRNAAAAMIMPAVAPVPRFATERLEAFAGPTAG
jgi:hypothetical protein